MTRIAGHGSANEYAGTLTHDFAYFSPDGKRFAVVLKPGNLEATRTNIQLVLFQTDDVFDKPEPKTLATTVFFFKPGGDQGRSVAGR